jgi:anaerobic ribonucleoside-triphosphate reductase activating protein
MWRYADLKENDIVDCESGICVSLWTQGCPFRCEGCHNPQTWDFNGGQEISRSLLINKILQALVKNGIHRDFSVLGGEPLCENNRSMVADIVKIVRHAHPDIKIYIWTGYNYKDLKKEAKNNQDIQDILNNIDVLIDGPFVLSKRDITLKLRGSSNQQIRYLKK